MSEKKDGVQKDEIIVQDAADVAASAAEVPVSASQAEWPWVRPDLDVLEGEGELLLVADMPGVSPDSMTLTLDQQLLTMEGRWARHGVGEQVFAERTPVNYRRSLRLPTGLDLDAVSARLSHGVLQIHLPFAANPSPRRIEIQAVN